MAGRRFSYRMILKRVREYGAVSVGRPPLRQMAEEGPDSAAGRNGAHGEFRGAGGGGPGRVPARAPASVPDNEPRRSIASQRRRVKICGEIPNAVTFVYRVYVL